MNQAQAVDTKDAKKNASAKNGTASPATSDLTVETLDLESLVSEGGFAKVSQDTDGFYILEYEGRPNPLKGILLAKVARQVDGKPERDERGNELFYYVVRLTLPCLITTGSGDDAKVLKAPVGAHVWVDQKKRFEIFGSFLPRRTADGRIAAAEVVFAPTKKIKLKRGRTMWDGTPLVRPLTGAEVKEHGMGTLAIAQEANAAAKLLPSGPQFDDADDDGPDGRF